MADNAIQQPPPEHLNLKVKSQVPHLLKEGRRRGFLQDKEHHPTEEAHGRILPKAKCT